ncbi:MAG: hypothetical protein ACRCTJ_05430 [Brevinema sp.]
MLFIQHRINTITQLQNITKKYGIEVDIRADGDHLILHHDAFIKGDNFREFLQYYDHAFIILNVKCEGLEERILTLMEEFKIDNYFFLDMSVPFLIKYMKKGITKIATRYSEYEPRDLVLKFAGKIEWLWVDGFEYFCLTQEDYTILSKYFKLCLVSPELQGKDISWIKQYSQKMKNMKFDAICTKDPEEWKNHVE